MRTIAFLFSSLLTLALIWCLNKSWGSLPPLGKLLSPQHGFWQNAEPVNKNFNAEIRIPGLAGTVEVWEDERMVPHIFAKNENDAVFVQGYLHARDRLWQMEVQTMASAGRLCEILGPSLLERDRLKRRQGMTYAAENALRVIEKDPVMKAQLDAYTRGVNTYIASLRPRRLPLEYKLLNYKPESWSNLKTCLLIKYMADDLAGAANDLEYTNARRLFSEQDVAQMFPDFTDTLDPIIPSGTPYPAASVHPERPSDSILYRDQQDLHFKIQKPDPDNGSNNWAVSGNRTRSGAPILCNDPHLGLNLPSLWYEVQINTPTMNVYGVSLPGAPGVLIGFNDFIGWGITNGSEDVKDYYRVKFRNGRHQYLFNGEYRNVDLRVEEIKIKGQSSYYDTVAYTVWGPVMFDNVFPDKSAKEDFLAMRWKAHDATNELATFYKLNRARNYDEYLAALQHFTCPAQNFLFAAKTGDIAIWHNGVYPLRWKDQGKFIMPGWDSTYAWQGYIPRGELPHIRNPERGYLNSANQHPTDSTYPYHLYGTYDLYRGKRINEALEVKRGVTVQDMMALQNDNKNLFAATALPFLLRNLNEEFLRPNLREFYDSLTRWDYVQSPSSSAATIFNLWWEDFEKEIWEDDFANKDSLVLELPQSKTTLLWLLRDSAMHFVDDRATPQVETLPDIVLRSFARSANEARRLKRENKLAFGEYRGTNINHLAGLPAFSRQGLYTGGGPHIVNATKLRHGPSWKMIVQLGRQTEAYGIYPGGQSGNPGSKFYDNSIDDWTAGKYYALKVFSATDKGTYKIIFRN
ncbi:penicillin acylase family protein [uncultured Chitinophaga sp.]|uniref:penicillin acylase family protein n=1 Tax=uncultured Chitinophaga sp. TaxID=339340 RepID=UPI0025FC0C20|nr:penicillin acylase family protein [uncultured Chitinophaga sp.]